MFMLAVAVGALLLKFPASSCWSSSSDPDVRVFNCVIKLNYF